MDRLSVPFLYKGARQLWGHQLWDDVQLSLVDPEENQVRKLLYVSAQLFFTYFGSQIVTGSALSSCLMLFDQSAWYELVLRRRSSRSWR